MTFSRGQLVVCIEQPDYLHGFAKDTEYVVNGIKKQGNGAEYLQILGDDGREHWLLSTMFRAFP